MNESTRDDKTPHDAVAIEPTQPKSLLGVLAKLSSIEEEFPPTPDAPPGPVDL